MSGFSSGRVVRRLLLAAPLALAALSGCSTEPEPYPSHLTYPARADRLVTTTPAITPWWPDNPGELNKAIDRIGVAESAGGVGGKSLNPLDLAANLRQEVEKALQTVFGKPARPKVDTGDDSALGEYAAKLKLDEATLAKGSVLYRRHCLHCHGVPGDGRGPTGPWLNPHPRDYRQGTFKFISTDTAIQGRKPRREDLLRTLHKGIEGTSMPSFGLEPQEDLEQLVSYVIHLSLRGEIEFDLLQNLIENKGDKSSLEGDGIPEHVQSRLELFLKRWAKSDKSNQPPPYPYAEADAKKGKKDLDDSVRRGYTLFTTGKASCISCHLDFGRQVPFRYDAWGTLVRPANLTTGVYRGGRRPIDLYWRIKGGIPPSAMPAADLKPEEYWDLVNFVQALPYKGMLPDDLRGKVYPESSAKASPAHASAD